MLLRHDLRPRLAARTLSTRAVTRPDQRRLARHRRPRLLQWCAHDQLGVDSAATLPALRRPRVANSQEQPLGSRSTQSDACTRCLPGLCRLRISATPLGAVVGGVGGGPPVRRRVPAVELVRQRPRRAPVTDVAASPTDPSASTLPSRTMRRTG